MLLRVIKWWRARRAQRRSARQDRYWRERDRRVENAADLEPWANAPGGGDGAVGGCGSSTRRADRLRSATSVTENEARARCAHLQAEQPQFGWLARRRATGDWVVAKLPRIARIEPETIRAARGAPIEVRDDPRPANFR